MQAYAKTDVGCVRSMNQDVFFYSTEPVGPFPNLFIVADGMGGHQAGDYASRYTIQSFIEYILQAPQESLITLIDKGITDANAKVMEKSISEEALAGMGTTIVVGFVENQQLYVANVGDSRLYLISDEITQVTEDHSFVAAMVRAGELSPEEARKHPDKNVITRAIGVAWDVKADFFEVDLQKGDRILLCTDGLSNMVSDDRIFEILSQCEMEDSAELLIEEAKKNGGTDNVTAIVLDPEIKEVNEW